MLKFIILFSVLFAYCQGTERTEGADVVNGEDVKLTERPFQVSLQIVGYHFCGGSIISEYYVLSAAHCTKQFNDSIIPFLFAAVGMIDVHKPGQNHKIDKFIEHEDFDPADSYRNDISLAKVQDPFTFNANVQPVPLPTADCSVPANSTVILSGWGDLGGKKNLSPTILQEVELYVVDQEECKKLIESNSKNHVYKTNLCAYDPDERRGQCGGDSGGPLTLNGTQVGVVSWSYKDPYCGSVKKPAQYTRVSEYIDWIEGHAK